jgi:hypothetical protein
MNVVELGLGTNERLYLPLVQHLFDLIILILTSPHDKRSIETDLETFMLGCNQVGHSRNEVIQYFSNITGNSDRVVKSLMEIQSDIFEEPGRWSPVDSTRHQFLHHQLGRLQHFPVSVPMFKRSNRGQKVIFEPEGFRNLVIRTQNNWTSYIVVTDIHEATVKGEVTIMRDETVLQSLLAAVIQLLLRISENWAEEKIKG